MFGGLHPQEHHLGNVLGQGGVVPGQAEDQVARLPDVDVVPGDVVQEEQGLARGEGGHVCRTEVDAVVLPPAPLDQQGDEGDHLVQGGDSRCSCVPSSSKRKSNHVFFGLIVVRNLKFRIGDNGGGASTGLQVELDTGGDGLDGEQELGLLVAKLGKVEEEGEQLGQVFQMRASCPGLQEVKECPDKPI